MSNEKKLKSMTLWHSNITVGVKVSGVGEIVAALGENVQQLHGNDPPY